MKSGSQSRFFDVQISLFHYFILFFIGFYGIMRNGMFVLCGSYRKQYVKETGMYRHFQ